MPPAGEQASKHTDLCMRGSSHANTIVTFVYTNGEFARKKSEKKKKPFMIGSKKKSRNNPNQGDKSFT